MAKTAARPQGLVLRKVADKTVPRLVRFDPETGEKKLVNPTTPGDDHEPYPLLGVELVEAPDVTTLSTTKAAEGIAEGWLRGEGEQVVVRPGGPLEDRWRVQHTFRHFDALVFVLVDGSEVRYRVTHQPDKYADGQAANDSPVTGAFDDETPVTDELYAAGATRVDHFYGLTKQED